jgi:hypothetical protein
MTPPTNPKKTPNPIYHDGVVHHPHDDGQGHDDFHNDDVAHEHSDINIRAIFTSAVVIVVVTVVTHLIILGTWRWLESEAAAREAEVTPLARPATQMPATTTTSPFFSPESAAGPRLLTNEPVALAEQRAKDDKVLHGYGWVDEKSDVAYVSIDTAKKMLLKDGPPVVEGAEPPSFAIRHQARGEASGGRTVTTDLPDRKTAPGQAPPAPAKPHDGGH